MDTKGIDKDTIIGRSSDDESRSKNIKKDHRRDKSKNYSRSRSRNKKDSKRSHKHRSVDSRSPESNQRYKRVDREEKYNKYKDKNKKDYKYSEYDRSEKNRDYRENRSRDDLRDKRRKSGRRSSSSKRRGSKTRDNRSHSANRQYQSKNKEQLYKTQYERPISKDSTPSIEIKRRMEEINRLQNIIAPVSTSEPSKRNRELFICNLPEGLTPKEVMELMNTAMVAMDANINTGNPIIGAWMSTDQNCSFLEFRSPEETINALKLDGISLLGNKIKIGKPRYLNETVVVNSKDMFPTLTGFERDLNNPYLNKTNTQAASLVPSTSLVPTSSAATSKLLISNLPLNFDQTAIYQVLRTFGKIKNIELIIDPITGKSSGNCHLEYDTETATANALHYIMGMNLMGNTLYIRRSTGIMPVYSMSSANSFADGSMNLNVNGISMNIHPLGINTIFSSQNEELARQRDNNPSKVICFKNMISLKELDDEDDYDDLYDDVMEECKNYGKVIQVKIPRPNSSETVQGVGKVFVEYATRDGAAFSKEHLQGKNFRGRKVEVVYFPEDMFKRNQLDKLS